MQKGQALRRLNRQPIISPGGVWRLAFLLFILMAGAMIFRTIHHAIDWRKHRVTAPPEIREQAAECVLTGQPEACAIARSWRPAE